MISLSMNAGLPDIINSLISAFKNRPLLEKQRYINAGGTLLDLEIPKVMGILNITPDSFYSGSRYTTEGEIYAAAAEMLDEGADILDVGGYSSRPGASHISEEEEGRRVINAIKLVIKEFPSAIISVDTFRSEIAREAVLEGGARIINDISGGEADSNMIQTVSNLNVPYIMMHMKGDPSTMQKNPVYDDIVADIIKYFAGKIFALRSAGVKDILIDPGFGFGKTAAHNFELLRRLNDLQITGLPLMVGISRKSMIWRTLDITADEALNGTTALHAVALLKGADILRVHDVKEAVQAVRLISQLKK
jgi:dihydropteroate synthase